MAGPNLTAYLRLDGVDKANAQLKQLETQGDKTVKALSGGAGSASVITAISTGYTAVSLAVEQVGRALKPVIEFLKSSVKESGEAQRQNLMLANSVKGNVAALLEYNTAMQRRYSIDADTISQGQAVAGVMTNLGAEVMPLVTQAAIQLNAVTGGDLVTSFEIVARSINGSNRVLKQYGIDAKDAKTQSERLNLIIEATAGGMDIAKSKATDYKGSMDQLVLAFGDFKESIGDNITQSDTFNASLRIMADYLQNIKSEFSFASSAGDMFGAVLSGLTLTAAELGAKLEGVGTLVAALASGNPVVISSAIGAYAGLQATKASGSPVYSPGDVGPLPPGARYRTGAEQLAYQTELSVMKNMVFNRSNAAGGGGAGGGRTLPGGGGGAHKKGRAQMAAFMAGLRGNVGGDDLLSVLVSDFMGDMSGVNINTELGGSASAMAMLGMARGMKGMGGPQGAMARALALGGGGWNTGRGSIFGGITNTAQRINPGGGGSWWDRKGGDVTQIASGFMSGGIGGGLSAAGSLAGNSLLPGIGGLLGGWIGGGLGKLFGGKKKQQRDGQSNATAFIFQSPQLEDIRVAILNLAPSLRQSGGGINSTVRNIALQSAR